MTGVLVDEPIPDEIPVRPTASPTGPDRIFLALATGAGSVSLAIVVITFVFLVDKSRPALREAGVWNFFTDSIWNPAAGRFGVFGLLVGTVIVATIAMAIAVPMALGMALFINEYAPPWLRQPLTTMMDLLAALPSLLYGLWALTTLMGRLEPIARWITVHLSVIPIFRLSDPDATLAKSSFVAGVVVAFMVLPIITSVSRDVMAQVPREQCEGALALGGTRWGMIREVILPFGRSGIVGAALLGFGRALGETIAVALVVSLVYEANSHVLELGAGSIAALIATRFGEADSIERSGLVAAGLALFLLTFAVNIGARRIVARSAVA